MLHTLSRHGWLFQMFRGGFVKYHDTKQCHNMKLTRFRFHIERECALNVECAFNHIYLNKQLVSSHDALL
ncbi:hypothetical protein chiPu_0003158 [Chiloscyllium punctatum]|uniref:Uncharacterized protein n=1 Tax=Chiloscyllium punctatum TaxID=137246 RepID=A0A401S311_CHIPU|nr:hypothetical protein [Chiloscyllium punctatum]